AAIVLARAASRRRRGDSGSGTGQERCRKSVIGRRSSAVLHRQPTAYNRRGSLDRGWSGHSFLPSSKRRPVAGLPRLGLIEAALCMADESNQPEQTYDEARARNLEALLRALAGRILELDAQGSLLKQAGELMRLIGDVKSELFHYEVRATYDTPDVAESRRIVRDAQETNTDKSKWDRTDWMPDGDEEPEW